MRAPRRSRFATARRVAFAVFALTFACGARSDAATASTSSAKLGLAATVEGECSGTEILPLEASLSGAATIVQPVEVSYACTAGETPTIAVDGGRHYGAGSCRGRALASNSGVLACYEIEYGSSNDLAPNVATTLGASATGTAQTIALPFKITATAAGRYRDTLEVTFLFS
jgi:spore coat protein U-like protein